MFEGRYIFSQIVDFVSRREFDACIEKFNGNSRIRKVNCRDQFLALMFDQLTGLRSLRGIVLCLNVHSHQFYHLGFRTKSFTLSTLSRANQFRDWQIWRVLQSTLLSRRESCMRKKMIFQLNSKTRFMLSIQRS